ncbi:hypothetical protein D3C72_2361170 [compost metagenome]
MTQRALATSLGVMRLMMPLAPWVSTLSLMPALAAAFCRLLAARKVWATPEGQAVMASTSASPSASMTS